MTINNMFHLAVAIAFLLIGFRILVVPDRVINQNPKTPVEKLAAAHPKVTGIFVVALGVVLLVLIYIGKQ